MRWSHIDLSVRPICFSVRLALEEKRDLTHVAKDNAMLCSDRRFAVPLHSMFRPYVINAVGCLILSNMTTCTGYLIFAALTLLPFLWLTVMARGE